MNITSPLEIKVTQANSSKINDVDFNHLVFGKTFTDHMFECDFVDGAWQNPTIRPYGPLEMMPAAKVFHYGQAVFEGMKAYKDENDKVFLFRPEENFNRINISSKRLAIPEFPKYLFFEALKKLFQLDHKWVPKGKGNSLYLRPFVIATENCVSAATANQYKFLIIMSPVNAYYNQKLKVVIAETYSRSADGGVGFAKAAGNYAAQFYPTNLAREKGYQQVIWTDSHNHEYLEEAGTMNVFFRINDTLITAPTSDRILDGVTRKSIIALAEKEGIKMEVRKISVTELVDASNNGRLKEIFGSGTAAVISVVSLFSYKGIDYALPEVKDSFADLFKEKLLNIQYNISEDPFGWRHPIY